MSGPISQTYLATGQLIVSICVLLYTIETVISCRKETVWNSIKDNICSITILWGLYVWPHLLFLVAIVAHRTRQTRAFATLAGMRWQHQLHQLPLRFQDNYRLVPSSSH